MTAPRPMRSHHIVAALIRQGWTLSICEWPGGYRRAMLWRYQGDDQAAVERQPVTIVCAERIVASGLVACSAQNVPQDLHPLGRFT